MIQWALDRARSIAPPERIVTVVAREHAAWWERELARHPRDNVVVQPRNRGTAAGILLPLLSILERDPRARVVVLPSDHFVADEKALHGAVEHALTTVEASPYLITLLGITPEGAEPDYGWILPRSRRGESRAVARFVEKPSASVAAELLLQGAVWNSFVLAATGKTLLQVYGEVVPEVLEPFFGRREAALDELYESLPVRDFSRDLLERAHERLELVVVPPCGWTDLGTPERLRKFTGAGSPDPVRAQPAALSA